jgi:hypothetical protein
MCSLKEVRKSPSSLAMQLEPGNAVGTFVWQLGTTYNKTWRVRSDSRNVGI